MSVAASESLYSVEEYLELERKAEERHQYLDGYIFLMAGESPEHADISSNLVALVSAELRGTSCRVRTKDTKVRSGPAIAHRRIARVLFSYPDIVVICGEPQYHDQHRDVILNPSAIIEVLSDSTEAFDRGEKFHRYQAWNPTLTDYLLVSQRAPIVEHYIRQPESRWSYRIIAGLDERFTIESIGCTLQLENVYDRIVFPLDEEDEDRVLV